jgi:glycosyltransferase involved in cell wall biosynthesis
MAMGKAVLLPGIPTVVDYIRDGETGFLYDVDSEQDLGDKLRTLLSSDESVRRVGRAARAAIESEFSEAIMADRVAGLLHKLVRNSSTPFSGR